MEFPPYPNDDDDEDKTIKVWNLYFFHTSTAANSRPKAINFSSSKKMQAHILELIMSKLDRFDPPFKASIETYYKADKGNFTRIVNVFRTAQLENSTNLGFDIYWDDEPQVLL